jgi:hypothetical protein
VFILVVLFICSFIVKITSFIDVMCLFSLIVLLFTVGLTFGWFLFNPSNDLIMMLLRKSCFSFISLLLIIPNEGYSPSHLKLHSSLKAESCASVLFTALFLTMYLMDF